MIAWMLRTVLATAALAAAAVLVDALVRRLGLPRRPVWATSLALAAVLPAIARLLPAASPTPGLSLPPEALNALLTGATSAAPSAHALPATWLVAGSWALISGALVAALAYAAWRLRRLCAAWPTARLDDGDVVLSTGAGPLVVGLLRPRVVVPAWVVSAPEVERRMVLAHEREHVRAGDARLLAVAALVPALAPWNLPAWWLVRRLREAVETDCDRRVLAGGVAPAAYGRLLLSTAAGARFGVLAAVALAEPKRLLERRLMAMTEKVSDRRVRRLLPLALGAAVLLVVSCELARPGSGPASPVEPRADAADSLRALQADYQAGYEEGKLAAVATHMFADTGFLRLRGEARAGEIKTVRVRRLSPTEAEITTVDAQGHSEVHRVHVIQRTPGEPTEQAREDALRAVVAAGGGTAVRDREPWPAHDTVIALRVRAEPLIIMDGVPSTHEQMRALSPEHIQSVSVLKGEAARRAYGDRGANGVILITTK